MSALATIARVMLRNVARDQHRPRRSPLPGSHTLTININGRDHSVHGLHAMTRGQLLRALFDAHTVGATHTAARVELELLRRGQPLR